MHSFNRDLFTKMNNAILFLKQLSVNCVKQKKNTHIRMNMKRTQRKKK